MAGVRRLLEGHTTKLVNAGSSLVVARVVDSRHYDTLNPLLPLIHDQASAYGPVVVMATRTTYDPKQSRNIGITSLIDLPPLSGELLSSCVNSPDSAEWVAAPPAPRNGRTSIVHVRSLVEPDDNNSSTTDLGTAFDTVMDVVSEYIDVTGCMLSEVNTGILPPSTFFYSAVATFPPHTPTHTEET